MLSSIKPVQVISPVPRDIWWSVIETDPDTMPSQSPDWFEAVLKNPLCTDASRLYITEDNRRIIFPLVKYGIGGLGALVSPLRGWGYGGIIADGGVQASDIAILTNDIEDTGLLSVRIRPNPLHVDLWRDFAPSMRRLQKIAHVVDLEGGAEVVRARFQRSIVTNIKRAEKENVRVETKPGIELLGVHYDLVDRANVFRSERQNEPLWLTRIKSNRADPRKKWEHIARHVGDAFEVSIAWHGDRPAASGIVLKGRNHHGMRAAMDPELRKIGASALLNWKLFENACAEGSRWFHLGESANQGVRTFKEYLGAVPCNFEEFEFERIPYWRGQETLRSIVKKAIGFKENPAPAPSPNQSAAQDTNEGQQ